MNIPNFYTMNNGNLIPSIGLGVYLAGSQQTVESVTFALKNGYRLIDTASVYGNEAEVGEGIRQSGIEREDLFITTKAWLSEYGSVLTPEACKASLAKLGTNYLDLYLLHWPSPRTFDQTIEAYKAAELLVEMGLVKSIGVCNFTPTLLESLMQETMVTPAVNQIELHPYFSQIESSKFHKEHGIITQCWSPLGGIYTNHPANPEKVIHLLRDPILADIANQYDKTPAQVVLRWHLAHGHAVIPKSVNPERILENMAIFDFELTSEEMANIDSLNQNLRGSAHPDIFDLAFLSDRG